MIFRTTSPRNRLMLELMARGGMRISEVFKLTPVDILDQKLILRDPKIGKEHELVYIPQKLAERLKEYINLIRIEPNKRIFPITYVGARAVVHKAGELVGIALRPHDLRRHAATYASRSLIYYAPGHRLHSRTFTFQTDMKVSNYYRSIFTLMLQVLIGIYTLSHRSPRRGLRMKSSKLVNRC